MKKPKHLVVFVVNLGDFDASEPEKPFNEFLAQLGR